MAPPPTPKAVMLAKRMRRAVGNRTGAQKRFMAPASPTMAAVRTPQAPAVTPNLPSVARGPDSGAAIHNARWLQVLRMVSTSTGGIFSRREGSCQTATALASCSMEALMGRGTAPLS